MQDATAVHTCFTVHRLVQEVVRDCSWLPETDVATAVPGWEAHVRRTDERSSGRSCRDGTRSACRANNDGSAFNHNDDTASVHSGATRSAASAPFHRGTLFHPHHCVTVGLALVAICRAVTTRARFLALWLVPHAACLTQAVPCDAIGSTVLGGEASAHLARSVRGIVRVGGGWLCEWWVALWMRACTHARRDAMHTQVVVNFSRLGELAARDLGDLRHARQLCTWSLGVARAVYGDVPHWNTAMALHNAALVAQMVEDFGAAEQLCAMCGCVGCGCVALASRTRSPH